MARTESSQKFTTPGLEMLLLALVTPAAAAVAGLRSSSCGRSPCPPAAACLRVRMSLGPPPRPNVGCHHHLRGIEGAGRRSRRGRRSPPWLLRATTTAGWVVVFFERLTHGHSTPPKQTTHLRNRVLVKKKRFERRVERAARSRTRAAAVVSTSPMAPFLDLSATVSPTCCTGTCAPWRRLSSPTLPTLPPAPAPRIFLFTLTRRGTSFYDLKRCEDRI